MNKEEIKYDPVRDTFLKGLTYISSNPSNVLKVSLSILALLLLLIVYNNRSNNQDSSYNRFVSITTNKHLDGKEDISISSFKEVLQTYSSSESYNQAYVYLFNYYMENNLLDSLEIIVNDNKFQTNDDNIKASFHLMRGDYFIRIKNSEKAVNEYKKSIKLFNIYDREVYSKIKLCMLYNDMSMNEEFDNLYKTIDIDKINDFQLKSLYEQISS
jgi:predicted negative regulator of RcsB-dependent stress response